MYKLRNIMPNHSVKKQSFYIKSIKQLTKFQLLKYNQYLPSFIDQSKCFIWFDFSSKNARLQMDYGILRGEQKGKEYANKVASDGMHWNQVSHVNYSSNSLTKRRKRLNQFIEEKFENFNGCWSCVAFTSRHQSRSCSDDQIL